LNNQTHPQVSGAKCELHHARAAANITEQYIEGRARDETAEA